jgi:hypothetical protein
MNSFLYWMMKKETIPIQEIKYEEEEEPLITLNSVILPIDNYQDVHSTNQHDVHDVHSTNYQDVHSTIESFKAINQIEQNTNKIEADVVHQSDEKIEYFFQSLFRYCMKKVFRCPIKIF